MIYNLTLENNMNSNVSSLLTHRQNIHSYDTRNRSKLNLSLLNRHQTQSAFLYQIREWNSLPPSILNLETSKKTSCLAEKPLLISLLSEIMKFL